MGRIYTLSYLKADEVIKNVYIEKEVNVIYFKDMKVKDRFVITVWLVRNNDVHNN